MAGRSLDNEMRLLERRLQITAEIKEQERQIQQERSRNLLMADREGQLRAAMAEKLARERGRGFTAEEFMFLDQDTKRDLSQTNQNLLPPEMRTEWQQLREELGVSTQAIRDWNSTIEEQRALIEEALKNAKPTLFDQESLSGTTDAMLSMMESAGAALETALRNLADKYVAQFESLRALVLAQSSRISALGIGSAVANAQSAARG